MICEYCKKDIKKRKIGNIKRLINICQTPQTRVFCSKKCKDKWCFGVQSNKNKTIVVWSLGAYYDNFFFVKKMMKIGPSFPLFSYFSMHLNDIDNLKLFTIIIVKYIYFYKLDL